MVSKSKAKKVAQKAATRPSAPKRGIAATAGGMIAGGLAKLTGGTAAAAARSARGKRRGKGPAYWANKVLVAKLKRKYNRMRYAGV